jgi:hypothetical protein
MVHRSGVDASADGLALAGPAAGLASRRTLLAEAAGILVARLTLTLALPLAAALTLTWATSMLWCCTLRSRSAAATPPSASLPSGLTAGRRIRSLIHVALLVTFVFPRVAGLPYLQWRLLAVCSRSRLRIERYCDWNLVRYQLRPSGARNPRREERQHGKCGDWRTSLSYSALLLKRKRQKLLIRLITHFRHPGNGQNRMILKIATHKTDMGNRFAMMNDSGA